jgi:hypothetical protein
VIPTIDQVELWDSFVPWAELSADQLQDRFGRAELGAHR